MGTDSPVGVARRPASVGWRWPASSLLGSIGVASRERLLAAGTLRSFPPGRRLMREGDPGSLVIVLLRGVVKAVSLTSDGKEVLLAMRVGGDLVGEFAVLDNRPRSSTVTTCGPVTGCVISQAGFLAVLRSDSTLSLAVHQSVLAKMRFANQRRVEFTGFESHIRVARVVRDLAVMYGDREGNRVVLNWPLTQAELASLASVAEPTVQKALRWLRKAGVVTTGYRSIAVEKFTELSRIAGP